MLIVAITAILGLVAIVLALIISQHRLVTGNRVKIAPPPQPRQDKATTPPAGGAGVNGQRQQEGQPS